MPLFDVPGWSVAAAPVAEASTQVSKKRKRPSSVSPDKMQSAEVNLDKLVKRLKNGSGGDKSKPKKQEGKDMSDTKKVARKQEKRTKANEEKKAISRPKPLKVIEKALTSSPQPTKRAKTHEVAESISIPNTLPKQKKGDSSAGLTALQKGMKQSLDGARFRMINEALYKTDSTQAREMMKEDPNVYEEYHTGFRHQVQSWPTNPVEHYISTLSSYPQKTVIADLGCGDAAIARALIPKGMTVLSFDLISDGTFVVEADVCGKLPLPGSEGPDEDFQDKSDGEGQVVDVVICALSLMGTNWPSCIREAWRILKSDGELKIAEVASRFTDIDEFSSLVNSMGFRLKSKDDRNTHFTLFEFKKIARKEKSDKDWKNVLSRGSILKPCEYKRR